jgi:hypothetical protein
MHYTYGFSKRHQSIEKNDGVWKNAFKAVIAREMEYSQIKHA